MALEKWLSAELLSVMDETENTKSFFFKVRELESLPFRAGQFITFDLPISDKKIKRYRSYSIASAPNATNEFELIISYAPLGLGSNYLWNEIKVGSTIPFKGPSGMFTLPEVIENDLCMVATGTGIAPFRSMLLDMKNKNNSTKNIYLIFGTRYLKDVLYKKEMETLQIQLPNFKFHFTLSREDAADYTGRKGYVHPVYEELFADKRAATFYLCGWRNMVDEAEKRIMAMGYERKDIHLELYG